MIRSDHDATQEEVHHQISKVMNHGSKEEWGSAALCSMREALIYAHLNLGYPQIRDGYNRKYKEMRRALCGTF